MRGRGLRRCVGLVGVWTGLKGIVISGVKWISFGCNGDCIRYLGLVRVRGWRNWRFSFVYPGSVS